MWKSVRLSKYLGCRSSLEAYLGIGDMILEDDLGLNLCIVPTTCHVAIILDGWGEVRSEFLVGVWVKLSQFPD